MSELMKTLFTCLGARQLEEEAQAVQAAKESVRAAQKRLTYDEFENLWTAISDIEQASEQDNFVLGFRLGVQLTLEGLRPISPES